MCKTLTDTNEWTASIVHRPDPGPHTGAERPPMSGWSSLLRPSHLVASKVFDRSSTGDASVFAHLVRVIGRHGRLPAVAVGPLLVLVPVREGGGLQGFGAAEELFLVSHLGAPFGYRQPATSGSGLTAQEQCRSTPEKP
jgi:hypothetical protein